MSPNTKPLLWNWTTALRDLCLLFHWDMSILTVFNGRFPTGAIWTYSLWTRWLRRSWVTCSCQVFLTPDAERGAAVGRLPPMEPTTDPSDSSWLTGGGEVRLGQGKTSYIDLNKSSWGLPIQLSLVLCQQVNSYGKLCERIFNTAKCTHLLSMIVLYAYFHVSVTIYFSAKATVFLITTWSIIKFLGTAPRHDVCLPRLTCWRWVSPSADWSDLTRPRPSPRPPEPSGYLEKERHSKLESVCVSRRKLRLYYTHTHTSRQTRQKHTHALMFTQLN